MAAGGAILGAPLQSSARCLQPATPLPESHWLHPRRQKAAPAAAAARTWNTKATSVRGDLFLFLLLVLCVGGFVGMGVLGCGKLDLGVSAAKTAIERV